MKFSAKSRYALKLTVDLAEHINDGVVSLSDISERQDISKKFLEQIVPMLVRAGLIRASRGANGGYSLNKTPASCTVGDVITAVEGEILPPQPPENESDRKVAFVWEELHGAMEKALRSITLQDILEHNSGFFDYCI
ncbi:MAG: Rrf2 family transcriptional regulator [Ruminococcus sp.]|nr:Rrf2 family transcriptional regulator [Ruminococcus sp.]